MTHLRLLDPQSCPREGFPYVIPGVNHTFRGKTLALLLASVSNYYVGNGLPAPPDLSLLIETQWCKLNPGLCVTRDGSPMDTTCAYRGELVRWEGCETCGGVRAKVVACALFGEATEFRHDVGVKRCGLCLERKSLLTLEEQ